MKEKIKIWVDGNPKAYAIATETHHKEIFKNDATSNTNEYLAHKLAIEWAIKNKIKNIEIISDSQLVSYQLSDKFHIKEDHLRALNLEIWEMIEENNIKVDFRWLPRKENKAGKLLG
jgi:ribonuclease HI